MNALHIGMDIAVEGGVPDVEKEAKMKKIWGITAIAIVSLFMTTACGSAPAVQRQPGQYQPVEPGRNVDVPGFQLGQERRPVLGILPFVGGSTGDGDTIATLFSMELEILRAFTVVPRTAVLNTLFAEHEFQLSGLTDSDTIAGIGRMLMPSMFFLATYAGWGTRIS